MVLKLTFDLAILCDKLRYKIICINLKTYLEKYWSILALSSMSSFVAFLMLFLLTTSFWWRLRVLLFLLKTLRNDINQIRKIMFINFTKVYLQHIKSMNPLIQTFRKEIFFLPIMVSTFLAARFIPFTKFFLKIFPE